MAQQDELEKRLALACTLFDRQASALLKIQFTSRYGLRDRMRLLNLLTWSKRYKVPYQIVFQVLVTYWRNKFANHLFPGRLGVKPATLTGKTSRDILERFVAQTYGDNENESIWRDSARRRIIVLLRGKDSPQSPGITSDPNRFVSAYRQHIAQAQESAQHVEHRMQRRNFRNNPFTAS